MTFRRFISGKMVETSYCALQEGKYIFYLDKNVGTDVYSKAPSLSSALTKLKMLEDTGLFLMVDIACFCMSVFMCAIWHGGI